jgi:fumarate reductase subunit D
MNRQRRSGKPCKLEKFTTFITLTVIAAILFNVTALASDAGMIDANAAFDAVMEFLVPWIQRLGAVVMLIGGIMFGLGFKNDDADSKTRGVQTLVAGAIVIAVGAGYKTFLGG